MQRMNNVGMKVVCEKLIGRVIEKIKNERSSNTDLKVGIAAFLLNKRYRCTLTQS